MEERKEEDRLNRNTPSNHQTKLLPTEDYTSSEHEISTRTFYTEEEGRRKVTILGQPEHPRAIHSTSIRMYGNDRVYKIKKHLREGDRNEDPIRKVNFEDLYKSSWARRSPHAQIELDALKEVISAQEKNIETHLIQN